MCLRSLLMTDKIVGIRRGWQYPWLYKEKDLHPDDTHTFQWKLPSESLPRWDQSAARWLGCGVKHFLSWFVALTFQILEMILFSVFSFCGFGVKNYNWFLRLWVFHAVISKTSFSSFLGNWFLVPRILTRYTSWLPVSYQDTWPFWHFAL